MSKWNNLEIWKTQFGANQISSWSGNFSVHSGKACKRINFEIEEERDEYNNKHNPYRRPEDAKSFDNVKWQAWITMGCLLKCAHSVRKEVVYIWCNFFFFFSKMYTTSKKMHKIIRKITSVLVFSLVRVDLTSCPEMIGVLNLISRFVWLSWIFLIILSSETDCTPFLSPIIPAATAQVDYLPLCRWPPHSTILGKGIGRTLTTSLYFWHL